MRAETKTITPDVAAKMLANNFAGNRKIRASYVRTLAKAMTDGEFVGLNGQSIVIGADDGTLYDGQHRLSAIVQSGTTQELLVVYVDNGETAYKTMDAGTPRKAGDFIDAPNKTNVAATAKVMLCIERGTAPLATTLAARLAAMTNPTRVAIIDFFDANRERVLRIERAAARMVGSIGCGAQTTYAFFISLVEFCGNNDRLDGFLEDISSPNCTNATVVALRNAIVRKRLSLGTSTKIPAPWQLGILLDAYELYRAGNGGYMLNKGNRQLQRYDALLADAREQRGVA